jgi:hypothetical protein
MNRYSGTLPVPVPVTGECGCRDHRDGSVGSKYMYMSVVSLCWWFPSSAHDED